MSCRVCGGPTFGSICAKCKGEPQALAASLEPEHLRQKKAFQSMLEALRWLAMQACDRDNCGTVCLCPSCHARRAVDYYDPEWRP